VYKDYTLAEFWTLLGVDELAAAALGIADLSSASLDNVSDLIITNSPEQTISATLNEALAAGDKVYGSLDNGVNWTDVTDMVSDNTTLTWTNVTLSGSGTLLLKSTDAAGNDGPITRQAYELDTTAPTTAVSTLMFSADTGTSPTDFLTKTAEQTISGTH
jgi:hypothetical protein